MKKYRINECFYSLQGEGVRAGEPSIFLRFSKCNMQCQKAVQGFDCDTEFESGEEFTLEEIEKLILVQSPTCRWIVLTGGEPSLQVDDALIDYFQTRGYQLAIETNGLREISSKINWITVSPKTPEKLLKQKTASEAKYVRAKGQNLPETTINARHYLISPAFEGPQLIKENLEWCIQLTLKNPKWRLSLQQHKIWGVR